MHPSIDLSACEIAHAVSCGEFRAEDVADLALERVRQINPTLNALIDLDIDDVQRQARSVMQRLAAGEQLPLAGVPFTTKDNLWVGGRRATFGSRHFEHFVAPRDAWAVARLKEAGAVMLGITNCSEFACRGVTTNPLHGPTRHPLDPSRTPGGSSGGAVAAVASGMGALALATDAGGSIRRPAAHTGLVGFKPTLGRVPHPWGFLDPSAEISVVGPIARTVADVELAMRQLTSFDARDAYSAPCPPIDPVDRPLRLAFSSDLGCGFAIDPAVAAGVRSAAQAATLIGHTLVDAHPDWPAGTFEYPLLELQQAALAALYGEAWRAQPQQFDPDIGVQIELGFAVSGPRVARLLRLRELLAQRVAEFFQDFDLLLAPTVPCEPWPIGDSAPSIIGGQSVGPRAHAAYTPLFNYAGVPALSLPCGVGPAGMPLGLQIVGPRWHDERVLTFARQLEARLPWRLSRPSERTY
jgi:aspartyl-tRNA(Asn)/glutamyl-tRNA(Gln) amidotransferase subunit A